MPFISAGILESAVGMDKDVMKRLMREANIPIASFVYVHVREKEQLIKRLLLSF